MRKRNGCLIGIAGLIGACVIAAAGFYYVIIPRAQQATADQFREAVQIATADAIAAQDSVASGQFAIDETALSAQLSETIEGRTDQTVTGVAIDFLPSGFEVSVEIEAIEIGYTGTLSMRDGQIAVEDVASSGSGVALFIPADEFGLAVETGFNQAMVDAKLVPQTLSLSDEALIVTVVPAG